MADTVPRQLAQVDPIHAPGFNAGRASDLASPRDRRLYRALETVPGLLSWGTLVLATLLAWKLPVWAAFFIIAFDLYWLSKTAYLSVHHYHNWQRMKAAVAADWAARLAALPGDAASRYTHLVLLPYYREGEEVIRQTLESIAQNDYDRAKIFVVLAAEERAGEAAVSLGTRLAAEYAPRFGAAICVAHPADLPGEMPGKGSNIAYAAAEARQLLVVPRGLDDERVLVSAFDIDTVVYPKYFSCLAWHAATDPEPASASFQPVPLYNNNLWDAPSFSRVAALSSTFWQMIEQERPERLVTFSSHACTLAALRSVGYWQRNMVSEDSRIFWNLFFASGGRHRVVPMAYPVSMDANLAPGLLETAGNIYRQHRRWTWGSENVPYVLFHSLRGTGGVPFGKRFSACFVQLEGFWSLATNPFLILLLGWLPLLLGGNAFNETVLAYNLPKVTSLLMTIALCGVVLSAVVSLSLLPAYPEGLPGRARRYAAMVLQWILVPVHIIVFGAIPGLDAQTRLMLGRYMGFWVTPKHRAEHPASAAVR